MQLRPGEVIGHRSRMLVEFVMFDGEKTVHCAVSDEALDKLEGSSNTTAQERVAQFERNHKTVEELALRKFLAGRLEAATEPFAVLVRSTDIRR